MEGRYVATPGHLTAEAAEEVVVLHHRTGVYFGLNSVGKRIWELLKDPVEFSALVVAVVEEYDVSESVARGEVQAFLEDLVKQGLARRYS